MNPTLQCPLCESEVDADNEYCPECGETLKKE